MEQNAECEKSKASDGVVVLFTSNFQGGILQFTIQLGSTLCLLGYNTVVFVPDNASVSESNSELITIRRYKKQYSLSMRNKSSKVTAREIEKLNPTLVIFGDASIIATQVLLSLKRNVYTAIYIHDVMSHPAKFDIYGYLKEIQEKRILKQAVKKTGKILLLSQNSYNLFKTVYPEYFAKATWMPLGAHVPEVETHKPAELGDSVNAGYYLFFGRMVKYKGVIRLLKAYTGIKTTKPMLVLAGSGALEPEEIEFIHNNKDILLINRYIEDSEMLYLVNNALTVVLPYIEASQSGVIPIAYYFGVPVITSNVPGLIEFVENGDSGIICSDIAGMTHAMLKMCDETCHKHLSEGAFRFYKERLDWSNNLRGGIESLIKEQKCDK